MFNRASFKKHGKPVVPPLATPETVSASERAQIEARLDAWTMRLLQSDLRVPCLSKPLVPVFVHAPVVSPLSPAQQHHVVLVSASPLDADLRVPGATYVQGAGDDHESWAMGLTPDVFWAHRTYLLDSSLTRETLAERIAALVERKRIAHAGRVPWLPGERVAQHIEGTGIWIDARAPTEACADNTYAAIVHCAGVPAGTDKYPGGPCVLRLGLDASKRGLHAFSQALPGAVDAVTEALLGVDASCRRVLLCCEDGCHLSGALAVAVLAACYDDHRMLLTTRAALTAHREQLTKNSTQRRLQWLTSSVATASPSRAHLQRVNAYLMGPLRQVRRYT